MGKLLSLSLREKLGEKKLVFWGVGEVSGDLEMMELMEREE